MCRDNIKSFSERFKFFLSFERTFGCDKSHLVKENSNALVLLEL